MSINEVRYPLLEVDLTKLRHNIDEMTKRCDDIGINVTGIVKGFHAIPEAVKEFEASDCKSIGTSRLDQLVEIKKAGCKKPLCLIRVPMLTEIPEMVKYVDFSLQSELAVIEKVNEECEKQGKRHGVVLMADLGDLREGYWDKEEFVKVAAYIENQLGYVDLLGVGTNLGCYGSVKATPAKMNELIELAEKVEAVIGRELEIISGGGTTSTMNIFEGIMPKRINHLRIGEGIILAHDYGALFETDAYFMEKDTFNLKAEVIEVKDKPTHPVGELNFDAFGFVQEYVDRGIRRRALVALGKVDFGSPEMLTCKNDKIEIIGASSDHLILDIEDCNDDIKVGDIIDFHPCYANLVYLTSSRNVHIKCHR